MTKQAQAYAEMPRYKCHKEVNALKISGVTRNPNGSVDLFFDNPQFAPINIGEGTDWLNRYKPDGHDHGYYIIYADGYKSWSPSEAFEDGYTRI